LNINHAVELEDGSYTYQGTLSGQELKFIVEFGINELLVRGALPFLQEDEEEGIGGAITMPEPDATQ
jgi:hypothetical protein